MEILCFSYRNLDIPQEVQKRHLLSRDQSDLLPITSSLCSDGTIVVGCEAETYQISPCGLQKDRCLHHAHLHAFWMKQIDDL